jgi:peptidyl-prolyl cis-trans isomerase D
MAAIQKLRNNAGLLIIVIGVALFAFIIGEFLTSGGQQGGRKRNNVAVVNGKGIPVDYFQRIIDEEEELAKMQMGVTALDEQTSREIRERAWNDLIQNTVLDREFEKLGLTVSGDELFDMVSGENPHPFIMQFFADPSTGAINRVALNQFLQSVNNLEEGNQQRMFWMYLENLIYKERKNQKYNTLLRQGLYTTNLEADRRMKEMNTSVNFDYVVRRYNEIPDSLVSVSDADVKQYYKEHKNEFKQEKSRDIRYVIWDVVPSQNDVAAAEAWINEVKSEFEQIEAENTEQYVRANSDIAPEMKNFSQGELPSDLDAFAFAAAPGDVFGPYFEDNTYKLAKLSAIERLPDSVRASHILFQVDQSNAASIQVLADSLKTRIENGSSDIAELARQYSSDQSNSQEGGDLGWFKEGRMVQSFNDSCFYGKTGDVKLVYSQFGIHIVKITNQSRPVKKVKLAVMAREVRVSDATDQKYFAAASEFGAVNNTKAKFDLAISEGKASVRTALNIKEGDNGVTGLDQSRELIRWAYNAEEGDVTPRVLDFNDKYVVAVLDKAREEGFAPVEDVRTAIEVEVRKQKRAEQLVAKVNEATGNASEINELANELNVPVQNASNVKFNSYSIPNLGVEPKLQAVAVQLDEGVISPAIDGNNGVFVIRVGGKELPVENADNTQAKSFMNRSYSTRVLYGSMEVLNELAGVEDYRLLFF